MNAVGVFLILLSSVVLVACAVEHAALKLNYSTKAWWLAFKFKELATDALSTMLKVTFLAIVGGYFVGVVWVVARGIAS